MVRNGVQRSAEEVLGRSVSLGLCSRGVTIWLWVLPSVESGRPGRARPGFVRPPQGATVIGWAQVALGRSRSLVQLRYFEKTA